jgi:hypothetical protein
LPYFSGLKSLFLHIILTIVILDTTSLYQVLKFPSLIRHFTEHKELDQNISFTDFLSMHYWGEDIDDDDDEKDMQLPFKKFEIQHAHFLFVPFSNHFTFKNTFSPFKSDYGSYRPQVYYNTTLGALFRPPQA